MAMEHTQPTRSGPHMYFLYLCHVGGPYGTVALCQVALLDAPSDTAAASGVRLRISQIYSGIAYRRHTTLRRRYSLVAGPPARHKATSCPEAGKQLLLQVLSWGGLVFGKAKEECMLKRVHIPPHAGAALDKATWPGTYAGPLPQHSAATARLCFASRCHKHRLLSLQQK